MKARLNTVFTGIHTPVSSGGGRRDDVKFENTWRFLQNGKLEIDGEDFCDRQQSEIRETGLDGWRKSESGARWHWHSGTAGYVRLKTKSESGESVRLCAAED
ncbi:Uncharacterized protein Fot_41921 [Forsythia ovata]|uniref:Uncharacterized protein n=1 Tax=Forsythia ovata TaxID=205694 RepID=A0ABD1RJQ2_9LAMI